MLKIFSILFVIQIISSFASECEIKLRDSKIIPDFFDAFEATRMLNVTFLEPLECGVQLTPNEVRMEPEVSWNANGDEFFTILMSDCGQMGETRHWLVMNIPGNEIEKGEKVAAYLGAMPMEVRDSSLYF
jgi:phosphatidylethanolamine-binding protein